MITGGYLKEIPLPHRRRWPGEERQRDLHIRIVCYYGIGRHYYVSAEQEANPIWDSRDAADWGRPGEPLGWKVCWDDKDGRGQHISSGQFDTHIQATGWIEKVLLPQFSDHEITINCRKAFEYLREGD